MIEDPLLLISSSRNGNGDLNPRSSTVAGRPFESSVAMRSPDSETGDRGRGRDYCGDGPRVTCTKSAGRIHFEKASFTCCEVVSR